MGRKSKLTDEQWTELRRRVLAGEKPADMAREYGVSRAAVSVHVSKQVETVKTVANQIVTADEALRALSITQQIETLTLVDELKSISRNLAGAGNKAAMLSHRLIGMAHVESDKINEADLASCFESLKNVSTLTKMANEASAIPLNLLAANKDRMKGLLDTPPADGSPLPADPVEASRAYQKLIGGG